MRKCQLEDKKWLDFLLEELEKSTEGEELGCQGQDILRFENEKLRKLETSERKNWICRWKGTWRPGKITWRNIKTYGGPWGPRDEGFSSFDVKLQTRNKDWEQEVFGFYYRDNYKKE